MKPFLLTLATISYVVLLLFANVHAQGDTSKAKLINSPTPEYPKEAKDAGYGGTVYIKVEIDENGNVISAKAFGPNSVCENVTDPLLLALRNSAETALKQAKFEPAMKNGKAVRSSETMKYNFGSKPPDWPFAPGSFNVKKAEDGNVGRKSGTLTSRAKLIPRPAYPPAARAVRATGAVVVRVMFDEKGDVLAAEPVSGHPLLQSAAVTAACHAKFEPVVLEGEPRKVTGFMTYNFAP